MTDPASASASADWQQRTRLLLGSERVERLSRARILMVGLGGVGAYAAEQLARAGVGHLTLVDGDTVHLTNLNRQLPALHSTLGQLKAEVMARRLLDVNPGLSLTVNPVFLTPDDVPPLFDAETFDFVVDAIDTLPAKCALIAEAMKRRVPVVSSMGAGTKTDVSQVRLADLKDTHHCPLSKAVRHRLKQLGITRGVPVVFSAEPVRPQAVAPSDDPASKKPVCGSAGYLTAVFGCYLAAYVLDRL